jgi:quinol monooxygenase YgiN
MLTDAITCLNPETKEPYHVVVIPIYVKSDCVDKFIEIISENARNSRMEKGIVGFNVIQSRETPTDFLLVEIYKTPEDQARHRETKHFHIFKSQVGNLLQEPYQAKVYHTI